MVGSYRTQKDTVVGRATKTDIKPVIDLIVGLAEFERLQPPDSKARARLAWDMMEKKLVNVFVAKQRKQILGYALYFYTYSSFLAKRTLYLEDIFVREESREKGVGEALFMRCVREAVRLGCGRMEWQVLTWNRKAIRFYQKLGAERLDEYRQFRLNQKGLQQLSQRASR